MIGLCPQKPGLARLFPVGLGLLFVLLTAITPANAYLVGRCDARFLFRQANLVVRGEVTHVDGGTFGERTATVRPDRVLKGRWTENAIQVHFRVNPDLPLEYEDWLVEGESGVFFLSEDNGTVVPFFNDTIHCPLPAAIPEIPTQATPDAILKKELVNAVISPEKPSPDRVAMLAYARKQPDIGPEEQKSLTDRLCSINAMAAQELGEFPSDEDSVNALKLTLERKEISEALRANILTVLLRWRQPEIAKAAVDFVQEHSEVQNGISRLDNHAMDVVLAFPSVGVIDDPALIVEMLRSKATEMRLAGVLTLVNAEMRDFQKTQKDNWKKGVICQTTLPAVMDNLTNDNPAVRYHVLRYLDCLNGGGHAPNYNYSSKDYVRSLEDPLVAYWAAWWRDYQIPTTPPVKVP